MEVQNQIGNQLGSRAELKCWEYFRERDLLPETQYPIGIYRADFAFPKIKMVVEYDGEGHFNTNRYDTQRDDFMEKRGWAIVRIKKNSSTYSITLDGREITVRSLWAAIKYVSGAVKERSGNPLLDDERNLF